MNPRKSASHGFTLIELLIVVAIIAILAAIAVPNFLAAQTRAKTSRVMNDMRTISVSMEMYRVDNNSFPLNYRDSYLQVGATASHSDPQLLTTPIAYMTTIPVDEFEKSRSRYTIYSVNSHMIAQWGNSTIAYTTYPKDLWLTLSIGPDITRQTGGWFSLKLIEQSEQVFYGQGGHDPTVNSPLRPLRYDPSNGTISYGDIYAYQGGGFSL
jgi:type II secretion system protein G